jgi:ketosteroid isomerase-like protein
MSAEHVEMVERFVDAFNRRDLDSVLDVLDPQVELYEWPEAPGARSYRGPDGVRAALDSWFEAWEWMRVAIRDIRALDHDLFITLHQRAKGKGSAVEVEIESYNLYTVDNGKVTCMRLFTDRDAAERAAGIAGDSRDQTISEEKR